MTKLGAEAVEAYAVALGPACLFRLKTWGFIARESLLGGAPTIVIGWHDYSADARMELRRFAIDHSVAERVHVYAPDARAAEHLVREWALWLEIQRRTAEERAT